MSVNFVNRADELARLGAWWREPGSRLGLVWGRRRVGKTALIRHFSKSRHGLSPREQRWSLFHTGAARGTAAELTLLGRELSASPLSERELDRRPLRDWDDALDTLADAARSKPLLVVLDEFPELVASSPELPNVLRAFLDRVDSESKLRILLAGSAVRYMSELAEERQPLYGRVDLSLQLHPFGPHDASLMLPGLVPEDRALVYGLLGGVPLYLSWWDQAASIDDNLLRLACQPGARLLTEGDLVTATEVERGEYPRAVLYAIANGKTKHNEIKQAIGAEPTRTLDRLLTLRLIERLEPVTAAGRTTDRRYRLVDNFLAFHLGLLSRFRSDIDAGLGSSILPVLKASLDDHLGTAWEGAVRDHLRRIAPHGALGEQIVSVGPWWRRDGSVEIDAVALSGRRRVPVAVAEAKWARSVDGQRLGRELRRKAESVPGVVDDPVLILAAREEVRDAPSDALAVTASDIFAAVSV